MPDRPRNFLLPGDPFYPLPLRHLQRLFLHVPISLHLSLPAVFCPAEINVYITFLEQKQYEDIYKGENITYGIIEIHFLYSLTANAEKFLRSVQNQVAELGVKIQYCVSQEGADEAR